MTDKDSRILHFSIGPVQGFIGQARRTRDLWAGSFLLSWLSGQAMATLIANGGEMNFPKIEKDELFTAICNQSKQISHQNPRIATLPNRFQAKVPEDFDASNLTQKIHEKWKQLADAVYNTFIRDEENNTSFEIWNRQIDNFWEVQWLISDRQDALDLRKNWRSQCLSIEGGKHCTMMGDYQELSGQLNTQKQEDFWKKVRKVVNAEKLNLRPNERLCAIALVKRLFVYLEEEDLKKIIGWVPGGNKAKLASFPSTSYMAAVPWLDFLSNNNSNNLNQYYKTIKKTIDDNFKKHHSEYHTNLTCLNKGDNKGDWGNLDGNLFNQTALLNWHSTVLSKDEDYYKTGKDAPNIDPDIDNRKNILKALEAIPKNTNATNNSSNFYALLLMDGDSLGELLRDNNPVLVSKQLVVFADSVKDIVGKYCGVTIYAGGDDVLALMPLHKVICCAKRLNHSYREAFCGSKVTGKTTLSGAIIFSHFHNPFTEVLKQAHYQLDTVAKDGNNRDSLAIAVMKPGGVSCQWVNTWDDKQLSSLSVLADKLHSGELPHSFYHKITDRYQEILKTAHKDNDDLFTAVLTAELAKTKKKNINIHQDIEEIGHVCTSNNIDKNTPQLSALYLANFLATEDKSRGVPT